MTDVGAWLVEKPTGKEGWGNSGVIRGNPETGFGEGFGDWMGETPYYGTAYAYARTHVRARTTVKERLSRPEKTCEPQGSRSSSIPS